MSLDLTGITVHNEYYSRHYLDALFENDLRGVIAQWEKTAADHPGEEAFRPPHARLRGLASPYFRAHNRLRRLRDPEAQLTIQMDFLSGLLHILGYTPQTHWRTLAQNGLRLPVLAEIDKPSGPPLLWVLPACWSADDPDTSPLSGCVDPRQYDTDPEQGNPGETGHMPSADTTWETIITRHVFSLDEPPRWILLVSFGQICLIDRTKWPEHRYLSFQISEIFNRRDDSTLKAMAGLLHRDSVCPAQGFSLLDTLDSNSHRHAFSVSESLKDAIRECVELLGNEAVYYLREKRREAVFSTPDQKLADRLTKGCLRYLYRLLFILYLEARPDLDYLPVKSETYLSGYSLESLRDMELVPLETDADQGGYFFDRSIRILFRLIFDGYAPKQDTLPGSSGSDDFIIAPLKSHLFDPAGTPYISKVRFRNYILQEIIQKLSLGRQGSGRHARSGRISYAMLGINQLGAVYENLLSYTGFFAKTDLFEVKPADAEYDPLQHAFFVPEYDRPADAIYHWLVPDPGMSVYNDRVVRDLKPSDIKAIAAWRKTFCKAFDRHDIQTLKQLSRAADALWNRHLADIVILGRKTSDAIPVWPDPIPQTLSAMTTTQYKDQQMVKTLRHPGSPYRRLQLAMDYWCALWFWPIEQARLLPTRDQFLMEMSVLLGAVPTLVSHPGPPEQTHMFVEVSGTPVQLELDFNTDDPSGIVNVDTLCSQLERLKLVREIAEKRRFFHWELEFADVFARRGGFDLIVGNPPWVKIEWNEAGLLSERNPAFAIRGLTAPQVARLREQELEKEGVLADYLSEYEEFEGAQNFLNALQNYPLLKGQQTNLYKCFITRAWDLLNPNGAAGFLHPEGVYDDPNGGPLRRELYPRLRYHFQYQNELQLFAEVDHHAKFSINIYHEHSNRVQFQHIANLFSVGTVDMCFEHAGLGQITGIKGDDGQWATNGHKDRIIPVDETVLSLFARLYDVSGTSAREARLPALHARQLVAVLQKFADFPNQLGDMAGQYLAMEMWHETNAQKEGTIRRETQFPDSPEQLILSGPHFFVGNPLNKTPREVCTKNSHYDVLDLETLPDDYLSRTNYVPDCDMAEYRRRTPTVPWGDNALVTKHYRLIFRGMLSQSGERTLIGAILSKEATHIHGALSVTFQNSIDLLLATAISSSIISDFFIKTTGSANLHFKWNSLPLLKNNLSVSNRVLALNCLTTHYADLWAECWNNAFQNQRWFGDDPRLDPDFWRNLTPQWQRNCALRTDFSRRWALVELDVLAARTLALTLAELQTIYRIQFPVLRQYEADTWYDQKGRIVFTCSKGLPGVGFSRPEWEPIKNMPSGTVTRTVTDNTLPTGPVTRTIVYHAPFTRCDRERDYAMVWDKLRNME